MNKFELGLGITLIALVVCFLALGSSIGETKATEEIRKEAVAAGVAEFYATPDGKVEFRWKGVE